MFSDQIQYSRTISDPEITMIDNIIQDQRFRDNITAMEIIQL